MNALPRSVRPMKSDFVSNLQGRCDNHSPKGCLRLAALLALPLLAGCSYVDKARNISDAAVQASEFFEVEALVQADIERKRMRAVRCHSPLLAPASLSAAAADPRLGSPWVDELLRDCPQFSAFVAELTLRRARSSGLLPLLDGHAAAPGGPRPAGSDPVAVDP